MSRSIIINVMRWGAVCILLVVEMCLWYANTSADNRMERYFKQIPEVDKALASGRLLEQVERTNKQRKVFSMLEALERHRGDQIRFVKIEATDSDKIVVEGRTKLPDEPNELEDRLREDPVVKNTTLEIVGFKDEVAQFYLTVVFGIVALDSEGKVSPVI